MYLGYLFPQLTSILYNNQVIVVNVELTRFGEVSEWCDKPTVKVAVTVDAPAVLKLVMDRLIDS